ncbi:MAG TPA: cation diffusion facilitator family transporter [Chryseolinea sp.]|nr:cation diffusion facilitator family transporter [Chryseolinea sp.]
MLVSMHDHSHDHHHGHSLNITQVNKSLIAGILLNIVFVLVEFAAGFFSGSLALISDAGHNLSDVASLALALLAFRLLKSKSTEKYTYGYRKASILISLLNAVILLIAVGGIGYESIQRFLSPRPVATNIIIYVAAIGIVINFVSALLFFRDREKDLNLKGAYLHLMVDALVSVGVVVSGIIMMYTQWFWIDPLISLIIMVVILTSTWNLLRDSLSLSMDAVPTNITIDSVREAALKLVGVKDIHHIHVWAISTAENALTAHLVISETLSNEETSRLKSQFKHSLEHLGIQHVTLETEVEECSEEPCR